MALILDVNNQDITITEKENLVSGSVNVYVASFVFSEQWAGYAKIAVFEVYQGKKYEVVLVNDSCFIPWEALRDEGYLTIGCYGILNENRLPTVYSKLIPIYKGSSERLLAEEPTPTVYEQLISIAQNTLAIAQSVRDDANNGVFKGEPASLENVQVEIETQKNQPNGLATLDENAKIPASSLQSIIKASYEVTAPGIMEIEFTGLDLISDDGYYEVVYDLSSPTADPNGNYITFAFNGDDFISYAIHQNAFDATNNVCELCNAGTIFNPQDNTYLGPIQKIKGTIKLIANNKIVFFTSECFAEMTTTIPSTIIANGYIDTQTGNNTNITSITINSYYELDVGSKVEIRKVR
jgi:hypothetical protein